MANEFIIRKGFKSQEDSQITGSISLSGSFKDQESSSGTAGQVLSSTVSGSQWVDAADSSAITGAGTTGKITKWTTGGSVIGDSIITEAASAITVTGDGTFTGGVTVSATTNSITIPSLADNGTFLNVTQVGNENWLFKCESLSGASDYVTIGALGGGKVAFGEDGSAIFEGEVTISSETQYLNFKKTSTSDVLSSIISETDAGTGGKLRFLTKRNGDSQVNALVINDNQNVGIGVTPSAWRDSVAVNSVIQGADNYAIFNRNDSGTKTNYFAQNFYYNTSDVGARIDANKWSLFYSQNQEDGSHGFYTSSDNSSTTPSMQSKLTITSTGLTQINSTNTTALELITNQSASSLRLKNTGSIVADWIMQSGGITAGDLAFYNLDTSAYRLTISSGGNVGIGTAPSAWKSTWKALNIGQSVGLFSQDNNTTGLSSNVIFDGSNWTNKNIGATAFYQQSEGAHYFYGNGSSTDAAGTIFSPTTRLTITSGGDTTITTTTNQGGLTITSATDNTTLRLINTATSGQDWRLYSTGGSSGLGVGKLFIKVGTTETAARLVSFVDDGSDIKMGIGTASPSRLLQVGGSSNNDGDVQIGGTNSSLGLRLAYDQSGSTVASIYNQYNGNTTSKINFGFGATLGSTVVLSLESGGLVSTGDLKVDGSFNSNGNATMYINGAAAVDPAWIYWKQGTNLRWLSGLEGSAVDYQFLSYGGNGNGMPRLILKEDGTVLIGKNSYSTDVSGYRLDRSGEAYFSIVNTINTLHVYDTTNSAYRFYVRGNGQISATQTSISPISSDVNLKTEITDYNKGLSEVLAMKPRYYKYKSNLDELKVGFIAQEMDEALSGSMIDGDVVNKETGGKYKTYQLEWYPLLVKAIQEQQSQIEELKSEIQLLKNN